MIYCSLLSLLVALAHASTLLSSIDEGIKNEDTLVFSCPDGMTFKRLNDYDTSSPGECVCAPEYVRFPEVERCYKVYKQGPCTPGSYVYVAEGQTWPTCEKNPCEEVSQVPYHGKCYTIESVFEEPCGPRTILRVKKETYQLYCDAYYGLGSVIHAPISNCPMNQYKFKGACRPRF